MSKGQTTSTGADERRLLEAAQWRAQLTETQAETSLDFEAWLSADPGNLAAWRQIQSSWECVGEHANSPELLMARRTALEFVSDTSSRRWSGVGLTPIWVKVVAAAAVLMTAGSLLIWSLVGTPDVYETAMGERRTVTLADGSQVALDSLSKLQVAFSDDARQLVLVRGQARFSVAHNPVRPFIVLAAAHKVVATGTAFNIDVLDTTLFVTLLSGQAVVLPEALDGSAAQSYPDGVELHVGEQLQASRTSPPSVQRVNLETATAWESGRLVLVDEPLSTVIMRISRYSDRTLRIADVQTAGLRISGVFDAADLDGFVATICSYLPILADTHADGSIDLRHLQQPAQPQSELPAFL